MYIERARNFSKSQNLLHIFHIGIFFIISSYYSCFIYLFFFLVFVSAMFIWTSHVRTVLYWPFSLRFIFVSNTIDFFLEQERLTARLQVDVINKWEQDYTNRMIHMYRFSIIVEHKRFELRCQPWSLQSHFSEQGAIFFPLLTFSLLFWPTFEKRQFYYSFSSTHVEENKML